MDITRDSVESWLTEHRRDRKWLAVQCGVSEVNVGHWLNKKGTARPIPAEHQMTIRRLMEEDAAKEEAKTELHGLVLKFDDSEYAPVEKAALQQGMTIREWAKKILNEAATMTDEEFFATFTPKSESNVVPLKPHLEAAAGSPLLSDVTDWDGADDTVLVKIRGLSMSPLLNDGDVISMHHKRGARSQFMKKGLIYLVAYDGGFTVKRYNTRVATAQEIEDGISYVSKVDGKTKVHVLESINPEFPAIVVKDAAEWSAWLDPKKDLKK